MTRKRLITAAVVLLGLVVAVEIGLRVVLGLGSPPLLQKDESIGYVFQADQELRRFGHRVAINEYHQRSEPPSERPDSSLLRVLFIGDSVTWGGVVIDQEETYPELFEQRAAGACTQPVEALNASAGSWGIGNLRAYVERFGTFESNLVVLQIGSHDLLQAKSTAEAVGRHPAMPDQKPLLALQEVWSRYFWPRYIELRLPASGQSAGPEQPDKESSAAPSERFDQNMQALRRTIAEVRRDETPILVVHTPDRHEVVRPETDEREAYRQRFVALLDSLDVPVLNLRSAWQNGEEARALFRDSVHLSEEGNARLARDLWSFISRRWDVCSRAFIR